MARYAALTDISDPALTVTESHLVQADAEVDGDLAARGYTPTEITGLVLPDVALTLLAVAHACRIAALEGAIGENSPLMDKAKQYASLAKERAGRLTRSALGLTEPSGGYGSVEIGRA